MDRARLTYYAVRQAEELYGPPVMAGDRIVYRASSRLPWIDLIFDIAPGTVCKVVSVEYDPAGLGPDHDPEDNHYHYGVKPLEQHGTLCTAEIVTLFDLLGKPCGFDDVCSQIARLAEAQAD